MINISKYQTIARQIDIQYIKIDIIVGRINIKVEGQIHRQIDRQRENQLTLTIWSPRNSARRLAVEMLVDFWSPYSDRVLLMLQKFMHKFRLLNIFIHYIKKILMLYLVIYSELYVLQYIYLHTYKVLSPKYICPIMLCNICISSFLTLFHIFFSF